MINILTVSLALVLACVCVMCVCEYIGMLRDERTFKAYREWANDEARRVSLEAQAHMQQAVYASNPRYHAINLDTVNIQTTGVSNPRNFCRKFTEAEISAALEAIGE